MDAPKRTFSSELEQLTEILDDALLLLDSSRVDAELSAPLDSIQPSLFEQCIEICRQGATREVEPIRTIHHLSCTGGTLITKCLAAMPNVLVLNEVAPLSTLNFKPDKPAFTPTDMLSLVRQGNHDAPKELLIQLFLQNLELLRNELATIGNRVLVRDHSHSHFLTGASIAEQPCLLSIVKSHFQTLSIVTVRDPVDSYLSTQKNGWLHFHPKTFDEYCRRYHAFLDAHEDIPMFRYEDFVRDPSSVVKHMCHVLQLKFSDNFIDTFDTFKFSGDSGRSGQVIEKRPRRILSEEFLDSIKNSELYINLINRIGYRNC